MSNNLIKDVFNNKINLISYFFVFCILTTLFVNLIHRTNTVDNLSKKNDYKIIVSERLTNKINYSIYFDRNCVLSESNEERKRVRWVWPKIYFEAFNFVKDFNKSAPYYLNIFFFSFLMFGIYFFLSQTYNLTWPYQFIILFYLSFILQNPLGEYQFSILETFFISTAMFLSKEKKFLAFLIIVSLAQLNRESGFLISFIWLLFNKTEYKNVIFAIIISLFLFVISNFRIIECLINPDFFVPGEYQTGQFNLSDVEKSINNLSFIKVLLMNFIIPFGAIYFFLFSSKKINLILLFLTTVYMVIFIVTIPWMHMAVRMLLLPFFIASIHFKNIKY